MQEQAERFESWALVEVMGHSRYAGFTADASIAGASFLRVDVPDCGPGKPAFTKFLGAGSIFSITPCSEEVARAAASTRREMPYIPIEAPKLPAPASVVVGTYEPIGDPRGGYPDAGF